MVELFDLVKERFGDVSEVRRVDGGVKVFRSSFSFGQLDGFKDDLEENGFVVDDFVVQKEEEDSEFVLFVSFEG